MQTGDKVIVRSSPSGCWYGELAARDGATFNLRNARRLWRWWAGKGVSLSGVAVAGLHPDMIDACRIAPPVAEVVIFEVCEVLATTEGAQASIENAPVNAG